MNLVPKTVENLDKKITVILTQRDVLLLRLCLEMVARSHTKGGSLPFDIRNLKEKLSCKAGKVSEVQ